MRRMEPFVLLAAATLSARAHATVAAGQHRRRERFNCVALAALGVVVVALMVPGCVRRGETPSADAPEMRVEINTPPTTDPISLALSPDGRQLVFVASEDGTSRLWLRRLDTVDAQPLAGTEGAAHPFWSPDSRSIAFFADGGLKRLDIGGGQPQTLTESAIPNGGTWNAEGVIVFTRGTRGPLFRIAASGGEATPVTKPDEQPRPGHWYPQFLPDGRQFLAFALGSPGTRGVDLVSLDTGETTRLTASDTNGAYLPSGWLLWLRGETLMAQRLDLQRKALAGDPVMLADQVALERFAGAFSVSAAGLVAYRAGAASRRQLSWFDRTGNPMGVWGAPDENALVAPSVSPDGRRVAVGRTVGSNVVQGNTDIWFLEGTSTSRFTLDAARDRYPIWSPDGNRIVFDSNRKGKRNLYMKPASGAGNEELLVEAPQDHHATDWSGDGRLILYQSGDPQTGQDLWVLPLEGDRTPWVFLKTNFNEQLGRFSPDGRWVAYMSNESGRLEIYVRPFIESATAGGAADGGGQRQVSTAGGTSPLWAPGGNELYYIAPDGKLMAAPITARGSTIEPGAPVALFQTRIVDGPGRQYDVTGDGRFLINTVRDAAAASPITLLVNWKPPQP